MEKTITRTIGSYGCRDLQRMNFEFAFRKACDIVIKYDFYLKKSYIYCFSTRMSFIEESSGNYEEVFNQFVKNYVYREDRENVKQLLSLEYLLDKHNKGEDDMQCYFRVRDKYGEVYWLFAASYFFIDNGNLQLYTSCRDVTRSRVEEASAIKNRILEEKIAYQEQLADDELRYKIIVEQNNTYVFEWTSHRGYSFRTPELDHLFEGDYEGKSIIRTLIFDNLVYYEDAKKFFDFHCKVCQGMDYGEVIARVKTKKNVFKWFKFTVTTLRDKDGKVNRRIGTINDINEVMQSVCELRMKAEIDELTGLYNMRTFYKKADELMKREYATKYALMRFDISEFRYFNHTYGVKEGDNLLKAAASIISNSLSVDELSGRLFGDVFVVMKKYYNNSDLVQYILSIDKKINDYSQKYEMKTFCGIYLIEDEKVPMDIMCDYAKIAVDKVKKSYLKKWAYYDDDLKNKRLYDRRIESDVECGIARKEFRVFFQPEYDIKTGEVVAAEALLRWNHPYLGLLKPEGFMQVLEKTGFALPIDDFVWETVISQIGEWLKMGLTPPVISVNVSSAAINDSNFAEKVQKLTKKYEVPHQFVCIEISEGMIDIEKEPLINSLSELSESGFKVCMDNYGVGKSTLLTLKEISAYLVKIDKNIIKETIKSKNGRIIVESIVSLAKKLGYIVAAEGVEKERQAQYLRLIGCDVLQGYYLSKPLEVSAFQKQLFGI